LVNFRRPFLRLPYHVPQLPRQTLIAHVAQNASINIREGRADIAGGHHDENEVGASDHCICFGGGLRRPRRELLARARDLAIVGHF
jgi:hypothetical protein